MNKNSLIRFSFHLSVLFFLTVSNVYASHFVGADLTYSCLSGNTYEITLNLYRDCAGATFPNSWNINISSASCGFNNSATVTLVSSQEVSAICVQQIGNTSCNGGSLPGIQQYIYKTTYTLPQACSDWVFSFSSCCRNYAITTGPGGNSFYVQSKLNNLTAPCNSSPVFSSLPVPYFCAGQLANYNHGAIEPDGDSLVYSLVNPLQNAGTSVTFNFPFNSNYPISTTPANNFGFNNMTGQMTFTPAGVQQGVLAVRVDEYRNGVVIGSVMRDIQVVVINCVNNSSVQIQPISNLSGAVAVGVNNLRVCAGNTLSFNIVGIDPNPSTTITMTSNAQVALSGSTFTTTGTNPVTGTLTWPTNANNVGYWNFTITVTDNNCPVPSVQVIGFTVNVFGVDIAASDYTFCPGIPQAVQLDASVGGSVGCPSGNCYSWSPATGLSATNIPNPIATVSSPITYTVTYNDGVCTVIDQVSFVPEGSVTATPPNPVICPGANVQLTATNTFPTQTGACNTNNSPCNGPVVLRSIGTGNTFNNTQFTSATPYNGYWHDSRFQMLIQATELTAAGFVPGLLRSLSLNVGAKYSNQNYQNFNIKMACSQLTALGSFQTAGFSTVYTGTVGTTAGINTYNFATPYQWDGVSNLIIEICFDNTSYYRSDPVYYTTTPFNSVVYTYGDNNSGCSMGGGTVSAARPNISINNCPIAPPVAYTWTSIAGSPASSLSATNIANPIASPALPTTYVVACDNGSCTVYDTVSIAISPAPILNNIPDVNSCPGVLVTLTATGSGLLTYSWNTGAATSSITVSPMTTTTYIVNVNTACGILSDTVSVIINDVVPPVINNCPANVIVSNDVGSCGAVFSWTPPSVSDNCPNAVIVQSSGLVSGALFPLGNSTITYTATDANGNTTTCSFMVTVNDTENPVISGCPANIAVVNDVGQCGAVVNWVVPTATDNCSVVVTQIQGNPSGSLFPLGTSLIEYTATDPSGNSVSCSFTITITDTENPSILGCPANIVVGSDSGVCGATINWIVPTVADNCPSAVIAQTQGNPAGSVFGLGIHTIEYTATDANGNSATCQFTITITDDLNPTAVCQNATIQLDVNGNVTITPSLIDNGSTDNCGITAMSVSPNSFDCSNIGVNVVTLTVTDASGNTATCNANITVEDLTPPIALCQNIVVQLDSMGSISITANQVDNGSSDACGILTLDVSPSSFTCANVGANTVTLTVTDNNANTSTCTATVTVQDMIPPIPICQNLTVVLDNSGNAAITAAQVDNGSTDNCGILGLSVLPDSFNCANLGNNTVTLTVTDVNGNTATCNATVLVQDNISPILANCPSNITQNNDIGACGALVTWAAPLATDNCPVVLSATHNSGDFFALGTTTVTYTAIDASGNTTTCSFDVTISDNEPPVLNCPADISVSANANCQAVVNWVTPNFTDNCPGGVLSVSIPSGSAFVLGNTTITYTATDASGNTATCSFIITVTDDTPPVILNCPTPILQNAGPNCDAIVNWVVPTISDNCPGATISGSHNSGSVFTFGTTTVTYTATDAAGNTATCSFDVTLQDNLPPIINNCPSNMLFTLTSRCDTVISWVPPVITDNCSGVIVTASHNPGEVFPLGVTTVTYSATDSYGNTTSCAFDITVNPPSPLNVAISQQVNANCFGQTGSATVLALGGSGSYLYSWTASGGQTTPFVTLNGGLHTVTVTDALAASCVAIDTAQVNIIVPSLLTLNTTKVDPTCFGFNNGSATALPGGGTLPYSYTWNTTPIQNTATATGLTIGTYTITLNDANNCQQTQSITLTEPDSLSASTSQLNVKCFGENTGKAVIQVSGGTNPYSYVWTGSTSITGTALGLMSGSYNVSVTDGNGCIIVRNFTITQPLSPLMVTPSHTDALCFGAYSGTATVTASGGTAPYTYTWHTLNPDVYTQTVQGIKAGNYLVTVRDVNLCNEVLTISVSEPPKLRLQITDLNHPYCDLGNGSATVGASGGVAPYTFEWNTNPTQSGQTASSMGEGSYQAYVQDGNGCLDTVALSLTNTPPAEPLFVSNPDNQEPILLQNATIQFINQSTGAASYSWNFGDGFISSENNPVHTFTSPGTYMITLTANNGYGSCPVSYGLAFEIVPDGSIYVPNAFTPNGDGSNDLFGASGVGVSHFEMLIYNRWGTLVKTLSSITDTWDGRDKEGKDVPEGVYTYKLFVRLNDGRTLEKGGTATLIR